MMSLVVDLGAWTAKVSPTAAGEPVRLVSNASARNEKDVQGKGRRYLADRLDAVADPTGLLVKRPCEQGLLVNRPLEREILDRIFAGAKVKPARNALILSQPVFNPLSLQKSTCELAFEDMQVASLAMCAGPLLSSFSLPSAPPCCVVVDAGYSYTTIVPIFDGAICNYAVRRVRVGGKMLTNLLKEVVTYRHWNMMDETILMNRIKERLCYVSLDFEAELAQSQKKGSKIARQYVLPDYVGDNTGHVLPPGDPLPSGRQGLLMTNERITVPEVLFRPSDIGLPQAGVAEATHQAIQACHPDLHGLLYSNILLTGGCALFPGFGERFQRELRMFAPSEYTVQTALSGDPVGSACRGGIALSQRPDFQRWLVSKEEYEEYGALLVQTKFVM